MQARPVFLLLAVILLAAGLSACVPSPAPSPTGESAAPEPGPSRSAPSRTQTPTPAASPSTAPVAMPTDCRAILSESVLAQLGSTPLNAQSGGGIVDPYPGFDVSTEDRLDCVWADPRADITSLDTQILRVDQPTAQAILAQLAAEQGFTCVTQSGGTRCETHGEDPKYFVETGRTLFWRDGIMIDTRYANLAPVGYTDSIIAALWP